MADNSLKRSRWMSAALRLTGTAVAAAAVGGLFSIGMLSLGQVTAPAWIKRFAEDRIASISGGEFVDLGQIMLSFDLAGFSPLVTVTEAELTEVAGLTGLDMSGIQISLDPWAALAGSLKARSLAVDSAQLTAEISAVSLSAMSPPEPGSQPAAGTLRQFGAFAARAMSALDEFRLGHVELLLRVSDTGKTARLTGGRIEISKQRAGIEAAARIAWELSETADATVTASMTSPFDSGEYRIELELTGAGLEDLEAFAVLPGWIPAPGLPIRLRLVMQSDSGGQLHHVEWQAESAAEPQQPLPEGGSFELHSFSAAGDYHFSPRRLTVRDLRFASSAGRADGAGYLDFSAAPDGSLTAEGNVEVRRGRPGSWKWIPAGISDVSAEADIRLNLQTQSVELAQLTARADGAQLEARGRAQHTEAGWVTSMEFGFENLERETLIALWPQGGAGARNWLDDRLKSGRIFAGGGGIRAEPGRDTEIAANFQFDGAQLEFIDEFPSLADASGYGAIEGQSLSLRIENGTVGGGGSRVDVSGTELSISGIVGDSPEAAVDLSLTGRAGPLLILLDHKPLNLMSRARIATDIAEGEVTASARFEFPVRFDLTIDDIGFTVNADAGPVLSREIQGGRFDSDQVRIAASNDSISVTAEGKFRGIPVSGQWRHEFTGQASLNPITGFIEISPEVIEEFGVSLPPGTFRGKQTADFYLTFFQGGAPEFGISTDARSLALSVPGLGAEKALGDVTQIVLEGRLENPIEIRRISLAGENYELEGAVKFSPDGSVRSAEFPKARFGDWLDVSAAYEAGGDYSAAITGGTADLVKASAARLGSRRIGTLGKPLRVQLDEVRLRPQTALTEVSGTVVVDKEIRGEFTAKMNGRTDVRLSLNVGNSGSSMQFRSNDAGALLRSAGILDNLFGGDIAMAALAEDGGSRLNIRLKIVNVRAKQMPTLSEVLSMASVIGMVEQLDGEGIMFSEVQADIVVDQDRVEFRRAFASGPSLGMTVEGVIDRRNGQLDLKGVITPLNAANELLILTPLRAIGLGKGDGIGAMTYFIRGPADNPTTGANPLSMLTPGIFKNIFQ